MSGFKFSDLFQKNALQILKAKELAAKQEAQLAANYSKKIVTGAETIKEDLGLSSYRLDEALKFNPDYNDSIETKKLYLYPCYEGNRVFQRIMCNYEDVDIGNAECACLFMSISTKELVGKIVGYLFGGMSEFVKHLGNPEYNVQGLGDDISTLGGFNFPKKLTVAQILLLERMINDNRYVENRVLEPDSLSFQRLKKDPRQTFTFQEDGVIRIKVSGWIFREAIMNFRLDSKLSGNTYILEYENEGESVTIRPDSEGYILLEAYDKIWDRVCEKSRKKGKSVFENSEEFKHKADVPILEYDEREKRKDFLEVQTIGRMFDSINYERWYENEKKYSTDTDVRRVLENAKKWAILMEDAMIKGHSIEETALPLLDDVTRTEYKSDDFGIYDSTLFKYVALLAPYWKYGQDLIRYAREVGMGNYGGAGSTVGLRRL